MGKIRLEVLREKKVAGIFVATQNQAESPRHTGQEAQDRANYTPSLDLTKGGGAVRSIGEKFSVNPATDTDRFIPGVLNRARENSTLDSSLASLRSKLGMGLVIGESPAFLSVIRQLPAIARYQTGVLILGETGTGKEVFARAIHYLGTRSAKPFIPVNCGAIPFELIENEFFGHESGAFTNATSSRRGLLKEADGGTLFLDEVDCLPTIAQVKLLRFLQDGQFRPLGSERMYTSDVRVIAASNSNLLEKVETGAFRQDLFYRLNVVSITLPPLRDRGEDIVLLAQHFLAKYAGKFGAVSREFSPEALQKLISHKWPGNVRELENVVLRAMVLSELTIVAGDDIFTGEKGNPLENQGFRYLKARAIAEFEQRFVRRVLATHGGNITRAAKFAGKDRRAFWELMRKHQIHSTPPSRTVFPRPGQFVD